MYTFFKDGKLSYANCFESNHRGVDRSIRSTDPPLIWIIAVIASFTVLVHLKFIVPESCFINSNNAICPLYLHPVEIASLLREFITKNIDLNNEKFTCFKCSCLFNVCIVQFRKFRLDNVFGMWNFCTIYNVFYWKSF